MILCFDIGNTHTKIGLFAGDQLRNHWRIATVRDRLRDEYAAILLDLFAADQVRKEDITGCVISSVVPGLTHEFYKLCCHYLNIEALILSANVKTGLVINTDYPDEVGVDLVANAVAAYQQFGGPLIIIGMGTATTFSAVTADGSFEGVAIAPGVATAADALYRFAAKLPQVDMERPPHAIGKNTIHSIQAGMLWGFTGLVEGMIRRFKAELGGEAKVVATGGWSWVLEGESNLIDAIEPDLTLTGLRLVYEMNRLS
jgi:type III pantothenate kinase